MQCVPYLTKLNHINNNKQQPPRICRKQLKYTPQADIDLNQPNLITKVANGTANLGQCTDKDDISQPRTVHGQRRHKPT